MALGKTTRSDESGVPRTAAWLILIVFAAAFTYYVALFVLAH